MIPSLCPAGLGAGKLTFYEYIDLAARHRFPAIDFGIEQAQHAITELGRRQFEDYLAERNVRLAVFGLPVQWRQDEVTFADGIATLREKAEVANLLGVTRCCTYILPATDLEPAEWLRTMSRRFAEIARILADKDIRLGLEWVGPHHLRAGGANATGANNVITNLSETLDFIADIGVPSLGLLVDSYHCYTTGISGAEIAQLSDAQIVHVHLNDARREVTPEEARDGDRLLPGEGAINLESFLDGLRAAGYTGYAAVEVLAPRPLADDPDTAAARVRESLQKYGL